MNVSEALRLLESENSHARLQAARYLVEHLDPSILSNFSARLTRETDFWTREVLKKALAPSSAPLDGDIDEDVEPPSSDPIALDVAQRVSREVLHELEPVVGLIRLAARSEIPDYANSQTAEHVERLALALDALAQLSQASSPPTLEEIDLAAVVRFVADECRQSTPIPIQEAGPSPFIAIGDTSLLQLAIRNGLSTAALSTANAQQFTPIVVTWGRGPRDNRVVVLDRGIGVTGLRDHAHSQRDSGVGLALARRAMTSLGGTLELIPRTDGGARLMLRWPRENSTSRLANARAAG
jgi:signal transduction histidine kinase